MSGNGIALSVAVSEQTQLASQKKGSRNVTITRLIAAAIMLATIRSDLLAQDKPDRAGSFNPKDLDNLEMFLESVKGLAIATNTSQSAYQATGENTTLDKLWSDKRRFPHGTVRWWLDQSPYKNDKRIRPSRVFKVGRDIGQDDHDRPGYIPQGCNGRPCVRGGLIGPGKGKHHNKQPCYFELQLESRDFKIDGPFAVFILARPVQQKKNATIIGQFHRSVLIQNVNDNRLEWKNLGKPIPVSGKNTLKTDQWQLLELHRDAKNRLQCVINGKDVTAGSPKDSLPFVFMFLFNNNKGQGFAALEPFAGDIAAFVVYRDELIEKEKRQVRQYFDRIYKLKVFSAKKR
jgi:hypothetical protein